MCSNGLTVTVYVLGKDWQQCRRQHHEKRGVWIVEFEHGRILVGRLHPIHRAQHGRTEGVIGFDDFE